MLEAAVARIQHHGCVGGAGSNRGTARECELCGEDQPALELPEIGAGSGRQIEGAVDG